jgi:hypothetical protein
VHSAFPDKDSRDVIRPANALTGFRNAETIIYARSA